MIHKERIQPLNDNKIRKGRFVLYWMQASQRAEYNHALEYAVEQANLLQQPVLVFFGLSVTYLAANQRHYYFMLQGLKEAQQALHNRNIMMVIKHESPQKGIIPLASAASMVITDRGYLKIQRDWRRYTAAHIDCPLIQVESDVIVPVQVATQKEEYSAATLRPKITRALPDYISPVREQSSNAGLLDIQTDSIDLSHPEAVISRLSLDSSVKPVLEQRGGTETAKKLLAHFLDSVLQDYRDLRNDPAKDCSSHLSPYLHFGQISPLFIMHEVSKSGYPAAQDYLEQLIIRRELAVNFVYYNSRYDSIKCLPQWAQQALFRHAHDKRPYLYSRKELENAITHDNYWNAAQRQMVKTGTMHNYMRMYWGKKIIEWSGSPQEAFDTALYLNNKYHLDGRDPNSYAGIAWCFGKHDRPWRERPVFGSIRYMNDRGLERKFEMKDYVKANL